MFKLDNAFLEELGLGALPAVEKNKMLAHIYETLEMRVGMKLAEQMSNEQLDEFESYINRQDEAGALKWLETNFPNYKQVVAEELEKLKGEIKQVAPQIVAQSQENALASQADSQQPAVAQPQQQAMPTPVSSAPQAPQTAQSQMAPPVAQPQLAPQPQPVQQPATPPAPVSQPAQQNPAPQQPYQNPPVQPWQPQ